jgi:integrase
VKLPTVKEEQVARTHKDCGRVGWKNQLATVKVTGNNHRAHAAGDVPAGKRVEHTVAIGLVRELPSKKAARDEVKRLRIDEQINKSDFDGPLTFGHLAKHYMEHELGNQTDSIDPKSYTTISGYKRNLKLRIIPKWGKRIALGIKPVEIESWLKALKREERLENPTLDRQRRIMSLVYKSAQRYDLIPRGEESNPLRFVRCATTSEYAAMTISPQQAFAIWHRLPEPESTLTLLAACTGLRISECLGLRWGDVDFASQLIHVRRTWTAGRVGLPKSKASHAAVPLHPILAGHMSAWHGATPYSGDQDWVFPSFSLKGKKPRVANMLVEDHLRPAAVAAEVLKEGDTVRFGFHNLRHSLASFLVQAGTNPKTVQGLLRHADVHTTLQIYAHSRNEDRMTAQGDMLAAMFAPPVVQ